MTTTTTTPVSTGLNSPNPPVIFALSVLIATLGTIANSLSLSYFITLIWFRTSRNPDATTKVLAALNAFDLLMSASSLLYFIALQVYDVSPSLLGASYVIFAVCIFTTSFLTCLLAVVRAIFLIFPFHEINWCLVKVSMLVYGIAVAVLLSMRVILAPVTKGFYFVRFLIVVILFLVVVISNALTMGKLRFAQSRRDTGSKGKRHATITVGIISVIYCVCNIGFIFIAGIPLYSISAYHDFPILIIEILIYIALPLNSACNPLVYLTRNAEMRSHLRTVWGRLVGLCWRTENRQHDADNTHTEHDMMSMMPLEAEQI